MLTLPGRTILMMGQWTIIYNERINAIIKTNAREMSWFSKNVMNSVTLKKCELFSADFCILFEIRPVLTCLEMNLEIVKDDGSK